MATDPVCGMEIYENTAPAMMQHQGVTYYFCSKKCFGKFQDRPDAYVMEEDSALPDSAERTTKAHTELLEEARVTARRP